MNFFEKIFQVRRSSKPDTLQTIPIYLDSQFRRSVQTSDQTVLSYSLSNQLQCEQFLCLSVFYRKTSQLLFKRKLNSYEKFSDLLKQLPDEYEGVISVGYVGQRNTVPKISSTVALNQGLRFIRSGMLMKFEETKNGFEECQLKLHHDYLTYYKNKSKEKKVSFLPLENATVEAVNEKKNIFMVKDKFKTIMFKTNSREDMIGWLVAISEAIKVRNAQIYLNELGQRLNKKIRDKVTTYSNKCLNLRDQSRIILLDEIGRKTLKLHFKKMTCPDADVKFLNIIQTYLYMCKTRRQRGQQQSQQILNSIRQNLLQMSTHTSMPQQILAQKNLDSKNDFIKVIQEIMKYLDKKYKKELVEKKYMHTTFQNHLVDEYKANSKIKMKSLLGTLQVNGE